MTPIRLERNISKTAGFIETPFQRTAILATAWHLVFIRSYVQTESLIMSTYVLCVDTAEYIFVNLGVDTGGRRGPDSHPKNGCRHRT